MTKEFKPDWTIATIKTKDEDFWFAVRALNNSGVASYEQILRRGYEEFLKEKVANTN